jgi:4-carboxymuconolactone decarboxylase
MTTAARPSARTPRIPPLEAPFPEPIADLLARMNPPGRPEILALFRVLAINPELAERTLGLGRYLLGRKAAVSLRDREVVITRACARCGAEYEWGVHVAAFADAAGFSEVDRRVMASVIEDVELLAPRDRCWCRWSTSCTTAATSTTRSGNRSANTGATRSSSS